MILTTKKFDGTQHQLDLDFFQIKKQSLALKFAQTSSPKFIQSEQV